MKPYYETELGKLYHGDCLEIMPELEPIDLVLTDPPYGITGCKWDAVIPFEPMWKQLKRIIKKNGAIILTASQPFTSALIMSNVKMFKYEYIWIKDRPSNFVIANIQPLKYHENILIFYNKQPVFNKQMQKRPDGPSKRYKNIINNSNRVSSHFKITDGPKMFDPNYKNPGSILNYSVGCRNHLIHPTQKPIELIKYFVKTYTNENEIILDFTIGSGTTAAACECLKRRWIGIEIEEKYCEIAAKRIEENLTVMERIDRSEKDITKKTGLLF